MGILVLNECVLNVCLYLDKYTCGGAGDTLSSSLMGPTCFLKGN